MEQMKINEREDPRVLRTRHLLLQAFFDLYSEKGFHAMTVQDITDRAKGRRSIETPFTLILRTSMQSWKTGCVSNFSSASRVQYSAQVPGA
jgi:hypothetical protein